MGAESNGGKPFVIGGAAHGFYIVFAITKYRMGMKGRKKFSLQFFLPGLFQADACGMPNRVLSHIR
jgi:hypothetical protein